MKLFSLIVRGLILLSLLLAPVSSVFAAPEHSGVFISLPVDSIGRAASLITPLRSINYGSFVWLQVAEADAAALAAAGLPVTIYPDAGQVRVNHWAFDPLREGEPTLAPAQRLHGSGAAFRLVQLWGPATDSWVAAIEQTGLKVLQYYPHNTYLTWGTLAQAEAAAMLNFVRWQGALHPAYKANNSLSGLTGKISNVDVMFYNNGDVDATLKALTVLGATVLNAYPSQPDKAFYDAIIQIDAAQLDAVSRLNTVLWMGFLSPKPTLDDEMSSQILAGNYSAANVPFPGYSAWLDSVGLSGAGVRWAIVDTGVDYDHPDLGSHIVGGYDFPGACSYAGEPGSDCPGGGHGTHVAGIVGGNAAAGYQDANGFYYGLGIAPAYEIFAMNSLSASAWPPSGGWQEHSKRAILGGAIGGNNSWTTGEGTNHGYQASERTHDIMVRDGNFDTTTVAEPFIEVFSAGNSGPSPSTLTAPKEGKNLIITASSLNYRAGSIDNISSFSSRGPAVDGRWVPTIAAPGEDIVSSRNDDGGSCTTDVVPGTNNLYAYCSGTSMAAPQTSGAVVLLTEWWRSFNNGANPSPAMAKALLVNGAVDMGTADIPNIHEGWGRVNIANVVESQSSTLYYDQTDLFHNTGDEWTLEVGVLNPAQPLKITLAWSDAPGAAGANPALVNNLNLTVQTNGQTYKGNVFSGGWSITGGTADTKNNLENVFVQTPGSNVVITVSAANLPGDGVPYNGDTTDQDFALICSNCVLGADFTLDVQPETQNICTPQSAEYTVDVGQILTFSDPVTLNAVSVPAGYSAGFSVNPVLPGGSSLLTLSGSATFGAYSFDVVGIAPTSTHTATVGLNVFTQVPGNVTLLTPANGAANQPARPTFTWNAATQGGEYRLQVADNAAFNTPLIDETVSGTSFTPAADLPTAAMLFWRVRPANACGEGAYSAVYMFSTAALPGDCSPGTVPQVLYSTDFETAPAGWSTGGSGGTPWAISTARAHSGTQAYLAVDSISVSQQYLQTPQIALPADLSGYTLQFWNHQTIEDSTSGCFDGGLLDVSVNHGAWTQIETGLQTDPYNGNISSSYSNPRGGDPAWCGDPQDWLNSVVDLTPYAGQTVQFRFVMATDSSVGREGWYIDDFKVQACVPGDPTANDDWFTLYEDTVHNDPLQSILTNDQNIGAMLPVLDAAPAHGELILYADGSFIYTPTLNFSGQVTFTYHLSDSTDVSNVATAWLTVEAVNDAPEILTADFTPALPNEREPVTLTVTFTDVESSDAHTALVDWGNGMSETLALNGAYTFDAATIYASNGMYTVSVWIDDGTDTAETLLPISVANTNDAPVILETLVTPALPQEGSPLTLTVTFTDAQPLQAHTAVVDWSNGMTATHLVTGGVFAFEMSTVYVQDGMYTVSLHLTDGIESVTATLPVTISNVAPVLPGSSGIPPIAPVNAAPGGAFAMPPIPFSDPGSSDTFTGTVDWGDESPLEGVLVNAETGTLALPPHQFAAPGTYTVTVTLRDGNGGESTFSFLVHVYYRIFVPVITR